MERLIAVTSEDDIFPEYRGTPIGALLEYHNLGRPFEEYSQAQLLVGMCMDNRVRLRRPRNFAYIIRSAGTILRSADFTVSYAIAVGGVKAIALVGHSDCGMVNLEARREAFIQGLVDNAGWTRGWAEEHFMHHNPVFEIGNEVDAALYEARRLQLRYPKVLVVPFLYRVEDDLLYEIREN